MTTKKERKKPLTSWVKPTIELRLRGTGSTKTGRTHAATRPHGKQHRNPEESLQSCKASQKETKFTTSGRETRTESAGNRRPKMTRGTTRRGATKPSHDGDGDSSTAKTHTTCNWVIPNPQLTTHTIINSPSNSKPRNNRLYEITQDFTLAASFFLSLLLLLFSLPITDRIKAINAAYNRATLSTLPRRPSVLDTATATLDSLSFWRTTQKPHGHENDPGGRSPYAREWFILSGEAPAPEHDAGTRSI